MNEDKLVEAGMSGEKLEELITEFMGCHPLDSGGYNRVETAGHGQLAVWTGQSPTGKKLDSVLGPLGRQAFPFDGASDTRIFMADEIIRELVSSWVVAFWRAMGAPKMSMDADEGYVVKLIDHLANKKMRGELMAAVELAANYGGTYGWYMLHPRWATEIKLEKREVTLEALKNVLMQISAFASSEEATARQAAFASEGQAAVVDFESMLMDERREGEAMEVLAVLHGMYAAQVLQRHKIELPPLSKSTLRRAVRDLRETGTAELPVPYVCRDEPEILALKPWDEVFIHPDTADVRKARVFRRVFMYEWELRAKIVEEGWSANWVDAALEHKGKVSEWGGTTTTPTSGDFSRFGDRGYSGYVPRDNKTGLVEVIYAAYHALDDDNVPGVYQTVFHPLVKDQWASHGLLEEGVIPYVAGQREYIAPQVTSSRGVPEVAVGWQREKKVLRDGVIDLTSLAVLPPLNVYGTGIQVRYKFGPAVQNVVQPGREPKFMEIPKSGAPISAELMDRTDRDADRYFGRMTPDMPPVVSQIMQQHDANLFLVTWARAFDQVANLCRIHMTDAEFSEITGAPPGWLEANRQNKALWTADLSFDVRELDPEFVLKQLEVINATVLPSDTAGVVDRRKYTRFQLQAVNPRLARELVMEQSTASQALFDQVNSDLALMFLGNIPRFEEMDPTAATKLQYAAQIIANNPNYQRVLESGGKESRFGQLLEMWAKNLQHSIDQERNKMIGRIGVDPQEVEG